MNLSIQNSWHHWLSTYHWQFSTGNHFHVKQSTNPRVTSILPTATFSLCALPDQFQMRDYFFEVLPQFSVCLFGCANHFTPFVFEFSLLQSYDPSWKLQFCTLRGSSVGFNSPITSHSLLLEFSCSLRLLRIICFRNFSEDDFQSRLLNAAEVVQRLFPAAKSSQGCWMLQRSCSAYSLRLRVCVKSLTRPEREEDLLVLTLCFTSPVGLERRPPAESGTTWACASACMHATTRVLTCPGEEDVLDQAR